MELLTVSETAELLKVSPITIRRYIADGRLPAVRVGRGMRVERGAIDRVIEPVAPNAAGGGALKKRQQRGHGRVVTGDDPLWEIVGMGRSDGPGDVSENKYKYLAEASLAEFATEEP